MRTLTSTFLLLSTFCTGQITLEHSYTNYKGFWNTGQHRLHVTGDSNNIYLYNSNHSYHSTIPMPTGYKLYQVYNASEELFDTDKSTVELLVVSWSYDMFILDWNGVNRKHLGNYYWGVIQKSGSDYQLAAYKSTPSGSVDIYSLPGILTGRIAPEDPGVDLAAAYPNPSSSMIHLPYDLGGSGSGKMEVFSSTGQLIQTFKLGPAFREILFDTSGLMPGQYVYHTTAGGNSSAGRFVVR